MREEGFYWVKWLYRVEDKWMVAELVVEEDAIYRDGKWYKTGEDREFWLVPGVDEEYSEEMFSPIGPKLEPPKEESCELN